MLFKLRYHDNKVMKKAKNSLKSKGRITSRSGKCKNSGGDDKGGSQRGLW